MHMYIQHTELNCFSLGPPKHVFTLQGLDTNTQVTSPFRPLRRVTRCTCVQVHKVNIKQNMVYYGLRQNLHAYSRLKKRSQHLVQDQRLRYAVQVWFKIWADTPKMYTCFVHTETLLYAPFTVYTGQRNILVANVCTYVFAQTV